MAQATHFVNCPHCGRIVEAVCPDIDKTPRQVKAFESIPFLERRPETRSKMACPHCGQTMYLYWYYT